MHIGQILILITAPLIAFCCSYKIFQIYQLNGYKTRKVLSWLKVTGYNFIIRFFALTFLSFAGMFVFLTCFGSYEGYKYLGYLFYCIFGIVFIVTTIKEKKKTPLKFTPRVIRSGVVFLILITGFSFLLIWLSKYTMLNYSLIALLYMMVIPIVVLSQIIMFYPERFNNSRYIKKAKQRLEKQDNLIKIGITGSYGKTTAKNILGEFLSCKYLTSVSPSSFNTPIGLASYINSYMHSDTQVLIAEMGARQSGDIKELCDFIMPQSGLITAIGKQHMETFGSIEQIVKTKYELIDALPPNGVAFFNHNCSEVIQMYEKCTVKKFISGEASDNVQNNAQFSNINTGQSGTTFQMTINNLSTTVRTPLLGAHIPSLITMCAIVAMELGVDIDSIVGKCATLEPIPHRLQLIEKGDTLILDDAYNSNPEGAKNALEILKTFDGIKIVITPGIVEQGNEQEEINLKLGEQIGEAVDFAIFTGPNSNTLKKGALLHMSEDKINITDCLENAVALLSKFEGKKAVLFENDLPDSF